MQAPPYDAGPPSSGPPRGGLLLPPPQSASSAWGLPVGHAPVGPAPADHAWNSSGQPPAAAPVGPPHEPSNDTVRPLDLTGTRTARRADDKLLLESEALHKRMLLAAAVHGSARSWRDRHRSWPAILLGLAAIVLIVAAIAVTHAFRTQSDINDEQRKELGITLIAPVSAPH